MASQTSFTCAQCGRPTLHERREFSTGAGCILTVLTAGLFLLFWAALALADLTNPWICQTCGRKRPPSFGVRVIGALAVAALLAVGVGVTALCVHAYRNGSSRVGGPSGAAPSLRPGQTAVDAVVERELIDALRKLDPAGAQIEAAATEVAGGKATVSAALGWAALSRTDRVALVNRITEAWVGVTGSATPRWTLVDAKGSPLGGWSEWKGASYVIDE